MPRHLPEVDECGHGWVRPLVCLVYLDTIIVHSVDLPTYLERLRLLFDTLLSTGLERMISKCKLLRAEVGFLEHRISSQGLATDPVKVEAVR